MVITATIYFIFISSKRGRKEFAEISTEDDSYSGDNIKPRKSENHL
ncbi:MAG: hypothetical protein K0R80_2909 [Clostridia bacterium]|jgi:hypothetical protein|nr:hypothetical protein [Clostridia bacterium]